MTISLAGYHSTDDIVKIECSLKREVVLGRECESILVGGDLRENGYGGIEFALTVAVIAGGGNDLYVYWGPRGAVRWRAVDRMREWFGRLDTRTEDECTGAVCSKPQLKAFARRIGTIWEATPGRMWGAWVATEDGGYPALQGIVRPKTLLSMLNERRLIVAGYDFWAVVIYVVGARREIMEQVNEAERVWGGGVEVVAL